MANHHADKVDCKKKEREIDREATVGTFMLRCKELGLSYNELQHYTVGMINDMLIEKSNDRFEYPELATDDDILKL